LLARGFGYPLYVVPVGVCTTARWTCQALFHVHGKLHWAYAPMSRKNRRQQLRKPQRGQAGGGRAARPAGIPPVGTSLPAQSTQPAAQPTQVPQAASPSPAPIPRPLPRGPRGRQQAGPLPTQDATIPLERVPYFRSDLRRIAITAGLMFVLLITGSIVLRGLLQA
jgi:hypothetical protein